VNLISSPVLLKFHNGSRVRTRARFHLRSMQPTHAIAGPSDRDSSAPSGGARYNLLRPSPRAPIAGAGHVTPPLLYQSRKSPGSSKSPLPQLGQRSSLRAGGRVLLTVHSSRSSRARMFIVTVHSMRRPCGAPSRLGQHARPAGSAARVGHGVQPGTPIGSESPTGLLQSKDYQ
jgi:hypothetical protein